MWLLMIFWKSLRGLWRLVIGLVIGVILYVITFTTPELEWIFNGVHQFAAGLHGWLSEQQWFSAYQKWDYLVKPADRLPLILYVLVGRFIWLLLEAMFITFPLWLINRQKRPPATPLGHNEAAVAASVSAAQSAPATPPSQGTGLETAIDRVADEGVGAVSEKVASHLEGLGNDEEAAKLERSIDQALDRIKHVEEQK